MLIDPENEIDRMPPENMILMSIYHDPKFLKA